jgi:hypothetical protein
MALGITRNKKLGPNWTGPRKKREKMAIKSSFRGGMDGYHAHHAEIQKMQMNSRTSIDENSLPIYREDDDGAYVEEDTSRDPYKELGTAKEMDSGY